jgi:hypothetical protein
LLAAALTASCGSALPAELDAAMYADPMCLPTSTAPPDCIAPMPGPHFLHPGFTTGQLDHLREQFPTVTLYLHGTRTVAEMANDWFLSINGTRHHIDLKDKSVSGDEASFSFVVDTELLDDKVAALDQDNDCKDWCAEEAAPGSIDLVTVEAWHKATMDSQYVAEFSFMTTDRRGTPTSHSGDGACSHACEACPYGSSYTSSCTCFFCSTYCALYNSFGQYMGTFVTGSCC